MPPQPTIVYLGNFRYPWCTEVHLTGSLESLGFRVVRLQEDRTAPSEVEAAAADDTVVAVGYQRTWGYGAENAALAAVWDRLAGRGIPTFSYHLDLYVGLEREATIDGDPFWQTSVVFTADGDPDAQATFDRLGIVHRWIPPAVYHAEVGRGVPTARYATDVVFVGSETQYHAEWPHRQDLLAFLRDRYGGLFRRFGPGPGTEIVRGAPLNDLYASARVVVGDTLCPVLPSGRRKMNYWSDRPFETVGRGGFLLMPDAPGLSYLLPEGCGLHYWPFGDFDRLGDLIDYYLDRPDDRAADVDRGLAHVAAHHTYRHRLVDALDFLDIPVPITDGVR